MRTLLATLPDRPALVLVLSSLVSYLMLGNHVSPLGALPEAGGDRGLMVWNLWIVNEAVTHGCNPYVTDRVYFPLGARLAKHTLVPGLFPVTFATQRLSRRDPLYPIYAYRVSILLCFSLALALSYLFLTRLGFGRFVSLVPAMQYSFSDFAMLHVPHLNHITALFLLPLIALCCVRLYADPRGRQAVIAGAVMGSGVYFTELIAFIYLAPLLLLLLAVTIPSLRKDVAQRLAKLGAPGCAAGVIAFGMTVAPFLVNWANDAGKAPLPRQASNWSANLAGFVIPTPASTPLYGAAFAKWDAKVAKGIGGEEVFLGFPLLLFAGLALARRPKGWTVLAISLVLFYVLLSLGPTLKVWDQSTSIPMPYAFLMKVPPFELGRTPVRCVLLALFFLMPLACVGLRVLTDALRRHAARAFTLVAGLLALAWATAEVYSPTPAAKPLVVPEGLGRLVEGPVVNVPLSVFDGFAVFLQTLHGRPIATGFVSRRTPEQVEHVRELDRLLSEDVAHFARRVESLGVRNVILGPGTPRDTAIRLGQTSLNVVDLRRQEDFTEGGTSERGRQ